MVFVRLPVLQQQALDLILPYSIKRTRELAQTFRFQFNVLIYLSAVVFLWAVAVHVLDIDCSSQDSHCIWKTCKNSKGFHGNFGILSNIIEKYMKTGNLHNNHCTTVGCHFSTFCTPKFSASHCSAYFPHSLEITGGEYIKH